MEISSSNQFLNPFVPGPKLYLFSKYLPKKQTNWCTTTVLTLSASSPLQTGRYVELTGLMMFFQLSMMCRHLIFYPNLDRNGEKKTLALILPWLWVIRQYHQLFLNGILKEFHCHIHTYFAICLFPTRILEWFWCILSTRSTIVYQVSNPFWNSLKVPEEF